MSERTELLGLLSEKKEELTRIKIKLDGLIKSMRYELNPYDSIPDLNLKLVQEYLSEARQLQDRYITLEGEVKRIEKDLGR